AYDTGDYTEALRHFKNILAFHVETSSRYNLYGTLVGIVKTLAAQGAHTRAVEFGVVASSVHKTPIDDATDEVEPVLKELEAMLSPEEFAAAVERGRTRELKTTITELLDELSQPIPEMSVADQALPEPLTERELQVLRLTAAGHSNREIASDLFLAVGTV